MHSKEPELWSSSETRQSLLTQPAVNDPDRAQVMDVIITWPGEEGCKGTELEADNDSEAIS